MGCPIIRWSSNTDDLNLSVLFWEHEFRHQVILSKIYKRSTSESLSTWTQISFPSTWFDEMLRCFLTWCCEVIDASHVMLLTDWCHAAMLFDVMLRSNRRDLRDAANSLTWCCNVIWRSMLVSRLTWCSDNIWRDGAMSFHVMLLCQENPVSCTSN